MNRSEPNSNYVRQQLSAFENDPRYYGADEALGLVFKQWPANVELSHVLIKVVLLNRLYNTNIFAVSHCRAAHSRTCN